MKQDPNKTFIFFLSQLEKMDKLIMHEINLCSSGVHEKLEELIKERGKVINIINSTYKNTSKDTKEKHNHRLSKISSSNLKIEMFLLKERNDYKKKIYQMKKIKKLNKAYKLNSVEYTDQHEY